VLATTGAPRPTTGAPRPSPVRRARSLATGPSLHVYAAPERGWCCYSCRRGGSIYDLAAELWGVGTRGREFLELRRRLLEAFAIEVGRLERSPDFDRRFAR
jgi:hypothetical protein